MHTNATSRNESFTINELSQLVQSGRIRIPQFQRSFRWDAHDVLNLFDSILRGYPFGSFLLWKRAAPAATLTIGAIRVDTEKRNDALWVVDGQQRITSIVNAIDPDAARDDERFRLYYSLTEQRIVGWRDVGSDLAIPLPDLFDFSRALAWLARHEDAADYASQVQSVASLLNRVEVSAAVIEQGDEQVLREIFDRINSRGRRLNAAEIFDAIHSTSSGARTATVSLGSVASSIDEQTHFGMLDPKIVVQALLVRRHPDITRDVHNEFSPNRAAGGAFPGETEADAYHRTEEALLRAVRFLQENLAIPHFSFLPFRFQLLVLVRFFAYFPSPSSRNIELLGRWFWRSSAGADVLGLTGSTADVRSLAANIAQHDESGSVQRLIRTAEVSGPLPTPNVTAFRTNHSAGKLTLAALWALHPVDPVTNKELSHADLVEVLGDDSSPAGVALEIFPRVGGNSMTRNAANRVIAVQGRHDFVDSLSAETDLESLLLDADLIEMLADDRRDAFLLRRAEKLDNHLHAFLADRTGVGLELTPPLADMDFDSDDPLTAGDAS